jgi:spore coat polysaccharide biosynthesis predicted glycosyltransferase SpsG
MNPHLIFRVHTDLRLGLGHVFRALFIHEQWKALGGTATLAVSGDDRARRVGSGRHPFLDEALPLEAVDLGPDLHASLPEALKARAGIVLVDQWDTTAEQIQALRPLPVAVMEDDGDAHEAADLLFQPFLEGVVWPSGPVKSVAGRKLRPLETFHGECRVVRGASFVVVNPAAIARRPRREPLQPLAVHKLLVTFGGTDGPGLAQRAYDALGALVRQGRWIGTCLLLAPNGVQGESFAGCTVQASLPNLTQRLGDFDAVWCAGGLTLSECLNMGVPVAAWGQNERQHGILSDIAHANACFDLGLGPEVDLKSTADALEHWLGPEGQETRQEAVRDGMALIDGMGASRVAQELWSLATASGSRSS